MNIEQETSFTPYTKVSSRREYTIMPHAALELLQTVYPHSLEPKEKLDLSANDRCGRIFRQEDTDGIDYYFSISKKTLAYQRVDRDMIFELYELTDGSLTRRALPKNTHMTITKSDLDGMLRNNPDRARYIRTRVPLYKNLEDNIFDVRLSKFFQEKYEYELALPVKLLKTVKKVYTAIGKNKVLPCIELSKYSNGQVLVNMLGDIEGNYVCLLPAEATNFKGTLRLSLFHLLRLADAENKKIAHTDKLRSGIDNLVLMFNEQGPLVTLPIAGFQQLIVREKVEADNDVE